MNRASNKSCQPTPVGRHSGFRSLLALCGCTLRHVKQSLASLLRELCHEREATRSIRPFRKPCKGILTTPRSGSGPTVWLKHNSESLGDWLAPLSSGIRLWRGTRSGALTRRVGRG